LLSPVVLDSAAKRGAAGAQLLGIAVHGSIIFLLPLYNQIALGVSPLVSSLRTLPYTLAVLGASIFVARLIGPRSVRRLGRFAFVAMASGLAMCALAFRSPAHDILFGLGLLLTGVGAGAANTIVANVLVASSPGPVAGEVGAVRGTVNNLGGALGASISGVALAAALGAALANGVARSAALGDAARLQLSSGRMGFVTDRQLERLLAAAGAPVEQVVAASALNELARLQALQTAFLVLFGMALLALLLAGLLPAALPQQDAGGQAAPEEGGTT
jgi:DHA2 family multidrug resistance protein-like MFS transporter